jgi:hypothetical protein
MAPDHMLAKIGAIGEDILAEVKQLGEYTIRASGNHYSIETFGLDIGFDLPDTFLSAKNIMRLAHGAAGLVSSFNQLIDIKRLADVTAFADIASYFRFHRSTSSLRH